MKTKDIAMVALMTVMICLCSWINIAIFTIVPFTMQTFGIFAALGLLGALTLCVFPYVLPDLGKIFLALVLVSRVKKHLAL